MEVYPPICRPVVARHADSPHTQWNSGYDQHLTVPNGLRQNVTQTESQQTIQMVIIIMKQKCIHTCIYIPWSVYPRQNLKAALLSISRYNCHGATKVARLSINVYNQCPVNKDHR